MSKWMFVRALENFIQRLKILKDIDRKSILHPEPFHMIKVILNFKQLQWNDVRCISFRFWLQLYRVQARCSQGSQCQWIMFIHRLHISRCMEWGWWAGQDNLYVGSFFYNKAVRVMIMEFLLEPNAHTFV